MVPWIPLCLRLEPGSFLKSELRRLYDHESHRDGNCCGDVFRPECGGTIADGCTGWRAEQQPDIGPSWANASASIGQRISINRGVGAERPGKWFAGNRPGVPRRAEFAGRLEKMEAARCCKRAHHRSCGVRR